MRILGSDGAVRMGTDERERSVNRMVIKVRCAECTHVRDSAAFLRNDGSGSESRLCLGCRQRRNRRCAKRRDISRQAIESFFELGRSVMGVK
jgi:hypothetical protein